MVFSGVFNYCDDRYRLLHRIISLFFIQNTASLVSQWQWASHFIDARQKKGLKFLCQNIKCIFPQFSLLVLSKQGQPSSPQYHRKRSDLSEGKYRKPWPGFRPFTEKSSKNIIYNNYSSKWRRLGVVILQMSRSGYVNLSTTIPRQ